MKVSPDQLAACLALASPNPRTGNELFVRQRRTAKKRAASPAPLDWSISFTVPIKVESESNLRDSHWSVRHKRHRSHQDAVRAAILVQGLSGWVPPSSPVKCELVRLGGHFLDSGNLEISFKGCQDGIAAHVLGCDDGDRSKVEWEYRQEPGSEVPSVRVTIRGRIGRTTPPPTP